MKRIKRIAATVCAFAAVLGMAACGSSDDKNSSSSSSSKAPDEIKLNSEAQEQVNSLSDKLGDDQLENTTIKFISHWDLNPGDGQVVPPNIQMFRDKYNGTIEWVQTTWEERYNDIAKYVLAKNSPDFFPAMDMDGFPKGAMKGMFQPFDDYLDFNSDLWKDSKEVNDAFMFNGGHYVAATSAYPQYICIYNPVTIKENGFEDPAELYLNDEWTFSKFEEMCKDFTDPENDKYGLDGWWYSYALNDAGGVPIITMENGKLVSNIDDPTVDAVQNFMYELNKSGVCYPKPDHGGSIRGDGKTGDGMGDHKTLFYPCGFWAIENKPDTTKIFGDVAAGEIMFVPMPRMDDSDSYYVSSRNDGYHLIKGAKNPEGVVAFLNCTQLCTKEAQNISLDQLRNEYKWTEDMINMRQNILELCKTNAVYDFSGGVNDALSNQLDFKTATMNFGDAKEWSTVVEENKGVIQSILDDANAQNGDLTAE